MLNTTKLADIFKNYHYIAAVYLFGSQSTGKVGPMSDIDIAVLFKDNAPKGRTLIHEMDYLAYSVAKALEVAEIDVVELNRQGLVFQHNVLRSGRLIYDADLAFRIKFVARVISEFCDFEPTLRFIERFHFQGRLKRCAGL